MIVFYHQTKIPINFWCRRGLNPRSFIQPSETLPVELIETHYYKTMLQYLRSNLKLGEVIFIKRNHLYLNKKLYRLKISKKKYSIKIGKNFILE